MDPSTAGRLTELSKLPPGKARAIQIATYVLGSRSAEQAGDKIEEEVNGL